ncbi:tRNA (adenosine(37)-N6)-dimethylallyltransferase MiaA [Auritidibacter ignavus]|uniref:tRNA (adenosine(37)-N6)-dimethylallyltransferase MiaA n=1 Tax=Auritidibacter ignavus TaxID=678932 RepID=UPI0024BADC41|nr:tRNA (adenosine(37)-N6)-dimethylallyltransferase MiaA [Auritidibacter ignavus]WHS27639.1 tRNA (adenosine(37)-N6)-dimethylallyltransferase MiaA [Auritidibacter ignavus]
MPEPVVAIVGPTATGKSDLALDLAVEYSEGPGPGAEIINADSMQFYPGMDIGTAKVPEALRRGIVHHLIDILPLHAEASVAEFQIGARRAIETIRAEQPDGSAMPIVVGGSGLYVRAALDDLEFPPTDPDLRARLTQEAEVVGIQVMAERLRSVDPDSAARLDDDRRIIRALEVHELTGRPFSSYMPQRRYAAGIPPVVQIGLRLNRDRLHQRIRDRVLAMLEQGWLEEVQRLVAQGITDSPTASRAIGYRQLLEVLEGRLPLDEAVEKIVIATRQFAKRQETWFSADPRVHWINADAPDRLQQAHKLIAVAQQRT